MLMTKPQPRRSGASRLVGVALALGVAAGLAAWYYFWSLAASQTDAVLTSWITEEAQAGRQWSCPKRHIGGYPFAVEVICPALDFEGMILDRSFSGSVGGFRAASNVFQPRRIDIRIEPPFTARTHEGDHFALQWRSLQLEVEGGSEQAPRLTLDGAGLALTGATAAGAPIEAAAETAQATLAPTPGAQAAQDVSIMLKGASAPLLSNVLALQAPLDATVSAVVVGADFPGSGPLLDRVERWRANGGRIDVKSARLVSGAAELKATGSLYLDEGRRPRGELDASLRGLDPTLRRFGVNPGLIAAGSLLTNFLKGSPGKEEGPQAIHLPLRIADGYVSIGPIRTPLRLPALY
ncbi:conserved hypothetical protein [Methylocella silvestris BL2]|uniref:DUF2125 domain-containing protein n=1 Tax=Methylocella silvestris (strain DSM 15510 / CIP 108128 / LMG 27833 / NCIMB 13906 / BL2) TaxID=395965 RepID=B8ETS3_METSB|nr:DUF2125 domain-containing protein [Methylocella silvestris]ACK52425.1 conserved hypothetical protein [Methylocella silvestris BL2]